MQLALLNEDYEGFGFLLKNFLEKPTKLKKQKLHTSKPYM